MEAAQPILVALFAITVMGSVGVDLTIDRVRVVFRRPRTLVVGLLLNHLAVPLLAFGIVQVCQLNEAVTIGFILCASAPGGPVGAMFTQRAEGHIAFAASLVVVMTALNTVTTPLLMGWLVDTEIGDGGAGHISEIAPRRQTRPSDTVGIELRALRLDEGVEARVVENAIQPRIERMPGTRRQIRRGDPHTRLSVTRPLLTHRHAPEYKNGDEFWLMI